MLAPLARPWEHFGAALAGSPIERAFLLALALCVEDMAPLDEEHAIARLPGGVVLHRELAVAGWRLDFAFTHPRLSLLRIGVELDGQAFHDRSARQADRDRRRDRELLEEGWSVLRFSGREVKRTPLSCALQAWRIVQRLGDSMGPGLARTAPREQMVFRFAG